MPIKGLSEQLRMPRLGKIHLGVKKMTANKVEYPTATDYFVCPPKVIEVLGDKPQVLPIMIPVEDEEYWASQYYRAYSQTRGLICKGDGETANRMVDTETKNIPNKDTKEVLWETIECLGRECVLYNLKKCNEMMCLQFMLPDVPGVGVWQVDSGSINSIRNINSEAHLIRKLCGHVSMLPLLLTLEPEEKQNPDTGKMQKHYFLHLRERDTLQKLLKDSQKPVFELLTPPVDEEQAARDIEELWPEGGTEPKEGDQGTTTLEEMLGSVLPEATPLVPEESKSEGVEAETSDTIPMMDKAQAKRIKGLIEQTGYSLNDIKAHTVSRYGKSDSTKLTKEEAAELIIDMGEFKIEKITT